MLVVDSYSINGVCSLLFYIAFLFLFLLFPEEILREDLEHGTWTPEVSLEPGLQTAATGEPTTTTAPANAREKIPWCTPATCTSRGPFECD